MKPEIDLRLTPKDVDALLADPGFAGTAAAQEQRSSIAYDTADRALRRAGFSLEVSNTSSGWVQKLTGEPGLPVESRTVDRTKLPVQGKLGRRVAKLLDERDLQPVFETQTRQSVWTLGLADGGIVQAVLERGAVRVGKRRAPICELHLVLESGPPQTFYAWLRALAERYPLRLAESDRPARGYALADGEAPTHRKADPLLLSAKASTEDAFVQIIEHCLDHHCANLAATLDGQVEGVHQMRVALRRLRAGLRLFRPLIPKEASAGLVAEIRWLNGFLGPARDWDVFFEEGLDPLGARFPEKRGLETLRRKAGTIRRGHYKALHRCLEDPRYHRLVLGGYAWLAGKGWCPSLSAAQREALARPIGDFAAQVLKKRHRRVHKQGRAFEQLSAEERHALRIRVKQLRYAVEFFSNLYPAKTVSAYRDALTALQDCLGALNDAAVAQRLLDEAGAKPATAARHLVEGWYGYKQDSQERGFGQVWKRFEGCRRP